MMPREVPGKCLDQALANLARLQKLAHGQTIFVDCLQFSQVTLDLDFALLALTDILLDRDEVCDLSLLILDGRNRCLFPKEITILLSIKEFSAPFFARCDGLP